ncbi:MAG: hypothetical protein EP339_15305 [Gammaproteobacteria bacterium]|uniref:D-glycerate 3-kinase, plant type n=1 Tax=Marinobacter nitratireducens TaxID=1137280 RepID=A0A072NID7_9GAMM|nr:hypothetical protein [Marinobacter nitratireducens]KEF32930.1 D-glycerate 3-kinase, plant type [Marinobacter nitratireducens]TNE71048.1 MAG: hypothetical protein EP339_15305 [Gammaproteobacteria bacterium]
MPERQLKNTVASLIEAEGLPEQYEQTVEQVILPLVNHILDLHDTEKRPIVVGIHGAQGTGKSTLTLFLREILSHHYHCPTASFSLDDIYRTRAERQALSEEVHPLFLTRGVPGTHDVKLGEAVVERLTSATDGDETPVPAFDKALDDRKPEAEWPRFSGRAEVVLVEGWCQGARPETDEQALLTPINTLESEEDPQGVWRRYVNDCLKGDYARFFARMDTLIMLKAPSMDSVLEWRTLQEHKLAAKYGGAPNECDQAERASGLRIMSDAEVIRFIMHYERVTRSCLDEMPGRADVLIEVAEDHSLGLPHFHNG